MPKFVIERQYLLPIYQRHPFRQLPLGRPARIWAAPRDPREIYRRRIIRHAPSAAVEGARGVGAVRPSRSCREPQQEQTCGPRRGLRRSSVTREGLAFGPSLIPAPAPTSTASHPCTQKRVGAQASGEGTSPLLI